MTASSNQLHTEAHLASAADPLQRKMLNSIHMLNRHGPINVPAFTCSVFIHSEKGGIELPRNNIILRSLKRNVTGSERISHLHRYSSIPIIITSLSTHLSLIAETNMTKVAYTHYCASGYGRFLFSCRRYCVPLCLIFCHTKN